MSTLSATLLVAHAPAAVAAWPICTSTGPASVPVLIVMPLSVYIAGVLEPVFTLKENELNGPPAGESVVPELVPVGPPAPLLTVAPLPFVVTVGAAPKCAPCE